MRRFVTGILAVCLLLSCQKARSTSFCSVGSEELNAAMDAWAASFKVGTPPQHEGRGSRAGAKALADGVCEMALSSEILPDEDVDRIAKAQGKPEALPIAEEVLAVVASRDFPADQISLEQLVKIYSDGEQDPSRLGWPAGPALKAHGINSGSDRYFWFRRAALDGRPVSDRVLESSGPLSLIDRLSKGPAIGYARPLEATAFVKTLKVVFEGNALLPDSPGYPLRRYYYAYISKPSEETKAFLRFVLSPDGQKSLKPLGLAALEEHARNEALLRLQGMR